MFGHALFLISVSFDDEKRDLSEGQEKKGGEGEAIPGEGGKAFVEEKFDEEADGDGGGDGCHHNSEQDVFPAKNLKDQWAALVAFEDGGRTEGDETEEKTETGRGAGREAHEIAA